MAGDTSTVTITFSEAVLGFTKDDLTVGNGTLSEVTTSDGGITWTATLTPTADSMSGDNVITLNNTGVTDVAGNAGIGTTSSNDYGIDTARPTATIVVADPVLTAGETSAVTITFSEAVEEFTNADLTVANGTLSEVASTDGGITWTAILTPSANTTSTVNVITLNNDGVADLVGNAGTGTTDSGNYAIDTARPTATINVADPALAAGETSAVTITFSEAVSGLTNDDLTVANGTLSDVTSTDGGITWTALLTPNANITDTTNVITLANTGVTDAAGNAGTGTTDSGNYAIDTARPTATITLDDIALKIGDTSLVTIKFSEAVTGFTNADLTVANGTLSTVSSTDGGITWTATLTPNTTVTDTTNVITLANTGVTDAAGNAGTGTTDSVNYAIDTTQPTSTIVVADTALAAGETSTVTITFSEAVTGFTNADLNAGNSTLSDVMSTDGGITWTATLTPSANTTSANNAITLNNGGVTDLAGNTGFFFAISNNYAIDTARPTATITVADTALAAGETSAVTITFSEAVSGLANDDLTVANGSLSDLASTDGGITWTALLTPNANITDTTNVITLANTGVTDAAGNAGTGTTDSVNYAIDTARPTATITLADTTPGTAGTTGTVTFSESVTGFTQGDLVVANATISGFAGSGTTYTFVLTPTTSGAGSVQVAANTVVDAAGNANDIASAVASFSADTVAPTATITVADTALTFGETTVVTIAFSEVVSGFTTDDLVAETGTLSALATADGGRTYTATFTPTANTVDTTNVVTLKANSVLDTADNVNTATATSGNYTVDTNRVELSGANGFTAPNDVSYTVIAGNGGSVITTNAGDDRITGGSGNDTIESGAGNDSVVAGDGNDVVIGGAGEGDDFYDGGTGIDTIAYPSQTGGLVITIAEQDRSGAATFPADAPADIQARIAAILQANGLPANTAVGYAYGGAIGVDVLRGFENVTGGAGNDVITGNAGANTIDAGAGDDLVAGGAGNDTLIGGAGNDTLTYADVTTATQVNLATGQVNAGTQGGVDTVSGFENVILGAGNDQFIGDGANNVIEGAGGNDQIDGGDGIDTVVFRDVTARDGIAIQSFTELQVTPGGNLGADRLSNVEQVSFVNGTDVFTVQVVDGNALVASRADVDALTATQVITNAVPATVPATVTRDATAGVLANDVNLDQGGTDQKVVAAVSFGETVGTVGQALTGTYGTLTLNADGGYTYVANQAATTALAAGATGQDVFSYTADDGDVGTSAASSLTITVTGTNEVPVITGTTTGGVTEDTNLSGTNLTTTGMLTATDADTGQSNFAPIASVAGNNGHGTFALTADGTWTYTAANGQDAVQQLGAGDTITDSFTAVSSDGTANQVVTVTITGVNDTVTLTGASLASYADTADTDTFAAQSGQIDNDPTVQAATVVGTLADADRGDVYTYALVGTPDATYGTLVLNTDGSYTFTPNAVAINALTVGTTIVEYQVQVSDNAGSTSLATFTVDITGANDTATIGGTLAQTVTEDVAVTNGTLNASGTVTVADADTGQATIQPQTGSPGDYGDFSIDAAGNWTYTANNGQTVIQQLGVGETLTDSFNVVSSDGTAEETVTVTINGTNDRPVLTGGLLGTYDDTAETDDFDTITGQITNMTNTGIPLKSPQFPDNRANGEIQAQEAGAQPVGTLTDVDQVGTYTFARAGSAEENAINDAYGTLTVNSDGSYSFTPNDAAINALTGPLTLTYTVEVNDGSGATNATNTGSFTLQLNGVNDTPMTGGATMPSVTEDAVFAGNLLATGTLTVTDADTNQSTYQAGTLQGTYGTLVINTDGTYTYTADNAQRSIQEIGQGDVRTDTFTVLTADGTQVPLVVTINGVNDVPVVLQSGVSVLVDTTGANNSMATATNLDTLFGYAANPDVGDATTVPHVSIQGTTSDGAIDYYSFTVGAGGGIVTLDVDRAFTAQGRAIDTTIAVYDASGTLVDLNDDGGDVDDTNPGEFGNYSFLTADLAAGTYTVAIDRYRGVGTGDPANPMPAGSTYALQVSLTNPVGRYTQTVTETDAAIALTGQLVVQDDVGDTERYARTTSQVRGTGVTLTAAQQAAIFAAFTVDNGTGAYAFNLASPDYLDAGQSVTATFTVRVTDQFGASTTQDVTYTINGTQETGTLGTDGDDVLNGTAFGDTIFAGLGDDTINGLGGNDQIFGQEGDDRIDGGSGDDTIDGGVGDDMLIGGSGNDTLSGGADNDTLSGGSGNDTLSGGTGNNIVDGGAGTDVAVLEATSADYAITRTSATTATFVRSDGLESDTFSNVESYRFIDGVTLTLGATGNTLVAGTGAGVLAGGAGNDTLTGGAGNDTLLPSAGTNTVDGGAGTDAAVLQGNYNDYAITQTGATTATFARTGETDSFSNVEQYRFNDGVVLTLGTAGADSFDLNDKTGAVTLATGPGDDAIFAGNALTGADRIDAGAGANDQVGLLGNYTGDNALVLQDGTLINVEVIAALAGGGSYDITSADSTVAAGQVLSVFGTNLTENQNLTFNGSAETDGSFLMFGGAGVDTLTGGAGNDGFFFGPDRWNGGDVVVGGAGTNDQLALDGNYTVTLDDRAGVEVVALLAGPAESFNTFDVTLADTFIGAGETKTIFALGVQTDLRVDASAETDGNVRLFGGQGNDTLIGGAGNDTLFGGSGRDSLDGGAGSDTFVFNAASDSQSLNYDTIAGFVRGEDVIQVNGQVYNAYADVTGGRLDDSTFDADLGTALNASLTNGAAVFFTADSGNHNGDTFLVVDTNGIDGYQAGQDLVVNIVAAGAFQPGPMAEFAHVVAPMAEIASVAPILG